MAVKVSRVDDLDNAQEATQTVFFSLDAEGYEIDLSQANVDKIHKAMAPFVKVARPVPLRDLLKRAENGGDFDPQVVRAWLISKGRPISDKGRVPQEYVTEWINAGRPTPQ